MRIRNSQKYIEQSEKLFANKEGKRKKNKMLKQEKQIEEGFQIAKRLMSE